MNLSTRVSFGTLIASLLLILTAASNGFAQPDLESCESPALDILDLATVVATQTIDDDYTIGELEVDVEITHGFIGSLEVTLETPESTEIRLIRNVGYSSDDAHVTFSDFGIPHDDDLTCECAMRPRGPQHLSDAIGESTMGDWTLTIADNRAGNTGTLDEWCVRVHEDVPVYPILDLTGQATDVEGVCQLTWSHVTAVDEVDVTIDGVFEETLTGPFAAGIENVYSTPVLDVPQMPVVICLTPRLADEEGPEACARVLLPELHDVFECTNDALAVEADTGFSWIDVTDEITVGAAGRVADVEVLVEATVPFNAWRMTVESPVGTAVDLHDGRVQGAGISVIFTDDGGEPSSAPLGSSARLQPIGPGFLADFIGEDTEGEWGLRIRTYSEGLLDGWCLNLEACDIDPPVDLVCVEADGDVELSWTGPDTYGAIDVLRDGTLITSLDGDDTSYLDVAPATGRRVYQLVAHDPELECSLPSEVCVASVGITEACSAAPEDVTWYANRLNLEVVSTETVGAYLDAFVALDTVDDESEGWDLRLTSPAGTTVLLHDEGGRSRDFSVYFSDDGVEADGSNQQLDDFGIVAPAGPGSMGDFHGESVQGIWELAVETWRTGTVDEWCVGWIPSCDESPPTDLTCVASAFEVTLTWDNEATYDSIAVIRNGAEVAILDGDEELHVDVPVAGDHVYRVVASIDDCPVSSAVCIATTGLTEVCDDADVLLPASVDVQSVEITVSESFLVQDVELAISIFNRVDRLVLISPEGTEVILLDGERRVLDAIFSDHVNLDAFEAREYLDCAGCRIAVAPGESLGTFRGEDAEGTWTLEVTTEVGATLESICLRLFEQCSLPAPSGLTCVESGEDVTLEWVNEGTYSEVEVYRLDDGRGQESNLARDLPASALLATVDGDETSFTDSGVERGRYRYFLAVVSEDDECRSVSSQCRTVVGRVDACDAPGTFVAGDAAIQEFTVSFPEDSERIIGDTEVTLEVTTTFTDAIVDIDSPAGTSVRLHQYGGGLTGFDVTYADAGRPAEKVRNYQCDGCLVQPYQGAMADFTAEVADGEWLLSFQTFYDSTIDGWCVGVYPPEDVEPEFLRGDIDGNGSVTALLDALALLEYGFVGGDAPDCMDAADVDDNGAVSPLLDALFLLEWQFLGTDAPPDPGPDACGIDPSDDDVSCASGC